MDVVVRNKAFIAFCIAISFASILYQTQYLVSSKDLNAWTEWTKRPELLAHFSSLGIPIKTQSTGSFGNVLSGESGGCSFRLFGADLSGGADNYFSSFVNDSNKMVFYYRRQLYDAPPTRKIMFLSQIDAMAVSIGMQKEIHPLYAIIYAKVCSEAQIEATANFGL